MPPMPPPERRALVAAVAGAVVGVTALTWGAVQLTRARRDRDASESAGVPPERWTKFQVASWLRDNGVSKSTAALCLRFNVHGEALLQLTERDLYRMGVPLRDARLVLAAVADLKDSPVLLARASQPPSSRQPSLASASSHPFPAQPVPVTTASPSERFEAAWQALVRTCVLHSDDAAPAEQQQRVVVYTSALLECFQALSPREQATALALVAAAEDNIVAPMMPPWPPRQEATTTAATKVPPPPPPPPAAAATAVEEDAEAANAFRAVEQKLQPLHAMVDGFLEFLQSPELDAVSSDEFDELAARVAGQVKRVVRVSEQLPADMGGPLLSKCEKVFEALARRQSGETAAGGRADGAAGEKLDAAAAAAAAATAGAHDASQQANSRAILQGVMDLVTAIKDPALRQLPPAQRVAALTPLVKRAEAIEALAGGAVADVPRDEQVSQMVQPVLQFLRDAVRAATAAAALEAEEKADEDGKAERGDDGAEGEPDMTNADIPIIVDTIQKIQETLQSTEFQHAPAEVRAQLCAVLTQRISALQDRTASLPPPTRSAVRELLQNTKAVLAAVGNAAVAASVHSAADQEDAGAAQADDDDDDGGVDAEEGDAGDAERKAEDGEAEAEEEEEEEAEEEAEEDAAATAIGIERYVEQLEKIFEFLTSEALEHAPASERKRMAGELMQRVEKIRSEIAGSAAEGPIVSELIEPLYDLLQNMATTEAPSKQFLEITAPLRDVQELLSSATFKQVPHAEKMRIARGIVPQLQQLTAAFATLSASERAAAEELVRPISEELLHIVRERGTSEASAQSVLDRLQAVMRTIQGAEFTTMTPAGRSAWAANAVAELQRLNDDCVALGPEGDALRPIVQRLETQLRGLCEAGNAEPSPDKASTPVQQQQQQQQQQGGAADGERPLWATVRAMQAELTEAAASGAFVRPARLQEMLSVLGAAAEAADMTNAEEGLLQDFGEALRKHVEAATAVSNGEDGGADNNSDEDGDEDALDSLRVSLQTLLDVALEDGGASGAELSSIAAKTEELIGMADEAGVKWREDAACGRAVRSILEILQQTGATGTQSSVAARGSAAAAPSKVEEVLQSSIQALIDAPPSTKEDFAPFMRVLQLAQPAAEQMTNRELVLLKTLQESVIEAMRRLPEPPHPVGEVDGDGGAVPEHDDDDEDEEDSSDAAGDGDDVDAVLDALLDMSAKLRDGSYTAEQLDEFEAIQHDLEDLLTHAGVDSSEAMASVQQQIQLQRDALRRAAGNGDDDASAAAAKEVVEAEEEAEEDETSPLGAAGDEAALQSQAQARESTGAFNEDDDEEAANGGDGEQEDAKP